MVFQLTCQYLKTKFTCNLSSVFGYLTHLFIMILYLESFDMYLYLIYILICVYVFRMSELCQCISDFYMNMSLNRYYVWIYLNVILISGDFGFVSSLHVFDCNVYMYNILYTMKAQVDLHTLKNKETNTHTTSKRCLRSPQTNKQTMFFKRVGNKVTHTETSKYPNKTASFSCLNRSGWGWETGWG